MIRLLGWLWGRLLLFGLLVVVIGGALVLGPTLTDLPRIIGEETRGQAQIIAEVGTLRDEAQRKFASLAARSPNMTREALAQRIKQRGDDLASAQEALAQSRQGLLAQYRPNKVLARKRAEIEMALIERELALLGADLTRREAADYFAVNPTRPTAGAVAAADQQCSAAGDAIASFNAGNEYLQDALELFRQERTRLSQRQQAACQKAAEMAAARSAHLAMEQQRNRAAALRSRIAREGLPASFADDAKGATLRDILIKALWALIAITLAPFIYRTLAYHALAPLAARWPPMRFAPAGATPPQPVATPSAISVAITLGKDDEALVRQDYLQSSSLKGAKRTRWLLDWRHPLSSLASGMRFLTAISGSGERVTISAVKDPFAELAILSVPQGAACVLRPSALAAVVETAGQPVRITSHWRLFSLPAWLTWQWRYLAFHGPAQVVVKGGRGVRIEAAERGRIVGEGQILGFSTDLSYSVIRSETFWPYFFGREALLKDKVAQGAGVLLIEEAPLAGRSGLRRGIDGMIDALLKVGGV